MVKSPVKRAHKKIDEIKTEKVSLDLKKYEKFQFFHQTLWSGISSDEPLRLSISDVFKGLTSGVCICGRIESGAVQLGQKLIVMPSSEQAIVKAISIEDCLFNQAFAGDQVTLTLTGCSATNIASGDILCDISVPSPVTTRFQAKVVVFANVQIPLTRGFQVVLHCKNLQKQATISKLISLLDKSTGQVTKTKPRCLAANSSGIVEIKHPNRFPLNFIQNTKISDELCFGIEELLWPLVWLSIDEKTINFASLNLTTGHFFRQLVDWLFS
ncbi:protein HBS1-like [Panonychus citri]|uniref:protein HBS1-like n=1 Tax=Panonychus citri TaxID=50023 RepID=UPI002306F21F|nr:protein HBS1-like [Panonychus citri]